MDSELDRTLVLDTCVNCTRVLFKSINTHVNTHTDCFYIVFVCLNFISTLLFNENASDTIYFGVRHH